MKFGKEIPAQATGHLNSQKGNGWRAQNSVWESIRWGKSTIAVLRPDMFEKLKLTISSAIIFCQVMWNLMLRLANRKRHKGPCTAGIFCYSSVLRMRFFPFPPNMAFFLVAPLSALLRDPDLFWKTLWGRTGTNDHKRRADLVRELKWQA